MSVVQFTLEEDEIIRKGWKNGESSAQIAEKISGKNCLNVGKRISKLGLRSAESIQKNKERYQRSGDGRYLLLEKEHGVKSKRPYTLEDRAIGGPVHQALLVLQGLVKESREGGFQVKRNGAWRSVTTFELIALANQRRAVQGWPLIVLPDPHVRRRSE